MKLVHVLGLLAMVLFIVGCGDDPAAKASHAEAMNVTRAGDLATFFQLYHSEHGAYPKRLDELHEGKGGPAMNDAWLEAQFEHPTTGQRMNWQYHPTANQGKPIVFGSVALDGQLIVVRVGDSSVAQKMSESDFKNQFGAYLGQN